MEPERAPWEDEAYAGSLFPAARPIPTKWISTDYGAVASVAGHRAEQEARAAARETQRRQGQSPEAVEAAWKAACAQARMEMRRERQQERIAAGIEPEATSDAYVRDCEEWVGDVAAAMAPALSGIAQGFAALSQSFASIDFVARWEEISAAIRAAVVIPAPFFNTSPASSGLSVQEMNDLKAAMTNGGWFPPHGHDEARQRAIASMDALATPISPAPKPRAERARYLPGTRHARRGRG